MNISNRDCLYHLAILSLKHIFSHLVNIREAQRAHVHILIYLRIILQINLYQNVSVSLYQTLCLTDYNFTRLRI